MAINILGKVYEVLLQKPPELTDALYLARNILSTWYDMCSELHVFHDVCHGEGLKKDMSLSEKAKLKQILNKWIKCETAAITWNSILKLLSEQGRIDIVREAMNDLESPAI